MTASICSRYPGIAFRKSIRTRAMSSPAFRRPTAALPEWPGRGDRSGSDSIAAAGRNSSSRSEVRRDLAHHHSNRFVTGVASVANELWHGTWEADQSELRRVDPKSGEVLEQIDMPPGIGVSGLEPNGGDTFFSGGGDSGKVRAVRRPR